MQIRLSPSLLGADFTKLGEQILALVQNDIEALHLDIMDGHFVPNITFGPDQIKMLRGLDDNMIFDAHLMVTDADSLLDPLAKAGVNEITVHKEACLHLYRTLTKIRALGMKSGVVLNPATGFEDLNYVVDAGLVDKILLMTVEPGFGGQAFIPVSLKKIADLRMWRDARGATFAIQVDGGVTADNIGAVVEAGANDIVVGSSTFKNGKIAENLALLRGSIKA